MLPAHQLRVAEDICPPNMPLPHNAALLLASHKSSLIATCLSRLTSTAPPPYAVVHPTPCATGTRTLHNRTFIATCLFHLNPHPRHATPQVLCYRYKNLPESGQLSDSPPLDHPDVEWVQRMGPDRERVLKQDEVPKVIRSRATVLFGPIYNTPGLAGAAAAGLAFWGSCSPPPCVKS